MWYNFLYHLGVSDECNLGIHKFVLEFLELWLTYLTILCTSRKQGEKEPLLFSYCGSFDYHALQSLNNCIFVSLTYQLTI